jgi:hypothetical protein
MASEFAPGLQTLEARRSRRATGLHSRGLLLQDLVHERHRDRPLADGRGYARVEGLRMDAGCRSDAFMKHPSSFQCVLSRN